MVWFYFNIGLCYILADAIPLHILTLLYDLTLMSIVFVFSTTDNNILSYSIF